MTDDKLAVDSPYDHILAPNGEWCVFGCQKCAYDMGRKAERERCHAIASSDVEVVDNVSGSSFMCKPNCSCAKDIMAGI